MTTADIVRKAAPAQKRPNCFPARGEKKSARVIEGFEASEDCLGASGADRD